MSPHHINRKLSLKCYGKSAHAGVEPEKGISAITVAAKAIAQMKLGRIDEETTANIGYFKGGKQHKRMLFVTMLKLLGKHGP